MEPLVQDPRHPAASCAPVAHLKHTSPRAMVRLRLDLHWESRAGRHTDCYIATRLNLWRDIFPPALEPAVMDKPVGHRASHTFAPGELIAPWRDDRLVKVRTDRFNRRFSRRGPVEPRCGRFYPKGILAGLDGIVSADREPLRIAQVTGEDLMADVNHPLADKSLRLDVRIEDIWANGEERGGRCQEIGSLVCAGGPGMQARWRDLATDFWSDLPYLRKDPHPDSDFYTKPRFVDHLDSAALAQVTALYRRLIPSGTRVLDLMSSWHSHLPAAIAPEQVAGLGMNQAELQANPALGERIVCDLNQTPRLPWDDATFDAVVCTVSVEYLTQPFAVFREVARVLKPGGRFVTSFSNRWFPPKAIRIWEDIHEFERPGLVIEYFLESALFGNLETWSIRGLPRPGDDKYAHRFPLSDPIYAVWGERRAT